MFIAMNQFKVVRGQETEAENLWAECGSRLDEVPAFRRIGLVSGRNRTICSSHSVWNDREAPRAWTKSEAFRKAHADAGVGENLDLGHPQFEGFDVILAA